jgi:transposase-like protein
MLMYRAVDSAGNTLEFLLSSMRDVEAAKRFFCKALQSADCSASRARTPDQKRIEDVTVVGGKKATRLVPRVINVDKNAAYPKALVDLNYSNLPKARTWRRLTVLQAQMHDEHGHTVDARQARSMVQSLDAIINLMHIQMQARQDGGDLPFADTLPEAPEDERGM